MKPARGSNRKEVRLTKLEKFAMVTGDFMRQFSPHTLVVTLVTPIAIAAAFIWSFQKSNVTQITIARAAEVVEATSTVEEVQVDPQEIEVVDMVPDGLVSPIADAEKRVTKKPFGIHIDPEHSPVPNDRFTGYHVGVDFEIFEDEQDIDVPIVAMCPGKLLFKTYAKGYGGLAVQECIINDRAVSIIYGHLNLASITVEAGSMLAPGERIGLLGKGHSTETDGVRKHLHLGIHDGSKVDIRGYVQIEAEIGQWLDVLEYLQN
jgi:murein DD-endopeptidase MepM/ murein hydrolase activator NlpD